MNRYKASEVIDLDDPFSTDPYIYLASDVEDERQRLREKLAYFPIYTTIKGSGMDAQTVNCYLKEDIASIFAGEKEEPDCEPPHDHPFGD